MWIFGWNFLVSKSVTHFFLIIENDSKENSPFNLATLLKLLRKQHQKVDKFEASASTFVINVKLSAFSSQNFQPLSVFIVRRNKDWDSYRKDRTWLGLNLMMFKCLASDVLNLLFIGILSKILKRYKMPIIFEESMRGTIIASYTVRPFNDDVPCTLMWCLDSWYMNEKTSFKRLQNWLLFLNVHSINDFNINKSL